MGDKLSQEEIDKLFNSFLSGDTSAVELVEDVKKEAKLYDFARPSKFGKEQLRSLQVMYDSYSRLLSSFLSGYLRTSVDVKVASAEEQTYSEFTGTLINPVILTILEFAPLKGMVLMELSAEIGYAIIDRILGGQGSRLKKLRDFSDLEKILLERVLHHMLGFIPEAWESVGEIRPRIEKIETNSQFAQIISPNDMTALVTLSIKIGNLEGFINFCIPYATIESIVGKLNTKSRYALHADSIDLSKVENIEHQLKKTDVPLKVIIGKTYINVSDFVHLQVGDIIPLDAYVESEFNVMIGDLLKYKAKPGTSRGKNAIQITTVMNGEE